MTQLFASEKIRMEQVRNTLMHTHNDDNDDDNDYHWKKKEVETVAVAVSLLDMEEKKKIMRATTLTC
ncbi:hypothetical protein ACHAWU_000960 [Discostella pseudostelligera]|uniref:Uncharacterized protein n=1 Tax=Discostella pseudostelligera TaxID=259834 RepID=A0ABD3NBB2_9STRA